MPWPTPCSRPKRSSLERDRHVRFSRQGASHHRAEPARDRAGFRDPEIPVDIYELGLIYKIDIDDSKFVSIDMTLTAPACPVAGEMPGWVETAASAVPGVAGAKVTMVFDPPWDQSRMSDEARVALDMW